VPPINTLKRLFPPAALVVALALVCVLALQNRSLRRELVRAHLQALIPPVGLTVPRFRGVTLSGDSVTIGRARGTQVLFFFRSTCPYCLRSLPVWNSITARLGARTRGPTVFGLTQDPDSVVRSYAADHGIGFGVVRFPDSALQGLYRADAVPLTIALDSAGRVPWRRPGVLTRDAVDSLVQIALDPRDR
jgi:hypothetical protein